MLELLTRWAPLAQFVGPLVAAVAAGFAAMSARASRRAAEITERAHQRAEDERARNFRPAIEVHVEAEAVGGKYQASLVATNRHPQNVAHRVVVEVSRSKQVRYREVLYRGILGHNQGVKSGLLIEDVGTQEPEFPTEYTEFVAQVLRGRVEYSDELGLARWSQRFKVTEQAEGARGAVRYHYFIDRMTAPKREPPRDEEED